MYVRVCMCESPVVQRMVQGETTEKTSTDERNTTSTRRAPIDILRGRVLNGGESGGRRDSKIGAVFEQQYDNLHVSLTHSLVHRGIRVSFGANVGVGAVLEHHIRALYVASRCSVHERCVTLHVSRSFFCQTFSHKNSHTRNPPSKTQDHPTAMCAHALQVHTMHAHADTNANETLAVVQSTSAPCSSSATTTSRWPSFCTAAWRAVMPVWSLSLASACRVKLPQYEHSYWLSLRLPAA